MTVRADLWDLLDIQNKITRSIERWQPSMSWPPDGFQSLEVDRQLLIDQIAVQVEVEGNDKQ